MPDNLRFPSIDSMLQSSQAVEMVAKFGRRLVTDALRQSTATYRKEQKQASLAMILADASSLLERWTKPSLQPLINATGVILHTNLGRAPLSDITLLAMKQASSTYSNLEFDLRSGKRGKRAEHAEQILTRLTGAESAYVVNNNAAAVLLVLTALARRKRVLVSRSQMVEIGGGFRIPDVMRQSGAKLVEIGTTNRLHLYDYENALEEKAAMILVAHHSNYKISGFTSEPPIEDICRLGHEKDVILFHDLGSGALLETSEYGLAHEPTVQESMQAGFDIISFSGDKLLGGPQAGIILGKKALITKIKKHPLARALRPDKLCLAGLSATLFSYLQDKAEEEIPIWRMISQPLENILSRAEHWCDVLQAGEIIEGNSMVGGGSLPGESLPSALLALKVKKPSLFLKKLRELPLPIIARIVDDRVLFDPRTVLVEQDKALIESIILLLQQQ